MRGDHLFHLLNERDFNQTAYLCCLQFANMEPDNLDTASNYLNNLLLARGLLKNGKPINFAQRDNGEDSDATMAQIINLVNDLVLRRDVRTLEKRNTYILDNY